MKKLVELFQLLLLIQAICVPVLRSHTDEDEEETDGN